MDLIDINRNFEYIFDKDQINSLNSEEIDKAVEIYTKLVELLFRNDNDKDKKIEFLEQKIDKLDEKISLLIYKELMKRCQGEKYSPMKEFIFKKYLNSSDNIETIISLIENVFYENGLNYIIDIETFLNILDKNKENYFDKYIKRNKEYLKNIIKIDKYLKNKNAENDPLIFYPKMPITQSSQDLNKIPKKTNYNKKNKSENQFILNIIKNIESIISFSRENRTFLIYFITSFWNYILNNFIESNEDNINICYKLREIFINYYNLVNEIFKNKDKTFNIKNDANNYYKLDDFSFLLDQIINKYINNNKELENIYIHSNKFLYTYYYSLYDLFLEVNFRCNVDSLNFHL